MAYVVSNSYFATLTALGCEVPRRFWSLPRHAGRRRTLADLFSTGFGQGGAHASLLPPISECAYACVHVCPHTQSVHTTVCMCVHAMLAEYTVNQCVISINSQHTLQRSVVVFRISV